MSKVEQNTLLFHGNNWEDLDRIVALAKFEFLQNDDYDDNDVRKCAYLSQRLAGPALDWVTNTYTSSAASFEEFDGFIVALKQAFGVEANSIQAIRRRGLDDLRWGVNVPVFFAEFDRLTFQLNITDHGTKIMMVQTKLPVSVKTLLAQQALDFANYETMRERLITMWALAPTNTSGVGGPSSVTKKPRCGSCGKKGHSAPDCRGGSKN